MRHHLKTGAQLGSSDCRQWVPPTFTVCSWGEQPENFPAPKSSSAGCSAPPQDRSGKVQLPSLISNNQKWRGNGHCVSFPIRQSLKAHSVYIASFPEFHFVDWLAKHFKSKTNTSFILLWLHSRCSYFIAKYLICLCVHVDYNLPQDPCQPFCTPQPCSLMLARKSGKIRKKKKGKKYCSSSIFIMQF